MWLALIHRYEGTDYENKRIVLSNQAILLHPQQGLLSKNENTLLFEKYTAGSQAAFLEIAKYQNQVVQETMVQWLIYGIRVQNNLTITLSNTKVKDYKLGNCLGDVSYMTTKFTKAFRVSKVKKNQRRGSNSISISAFEFLGKGRGGIGWGSGWFVRSRGRVHRRSNGPFSNGVYFQ